MSFEGIFGREFAVGSFGTDRYLRCYKDRTHISKAALDTYSNATYLGIDKTSNGKYQAPTDVRYIAATDIRYDMLISIYDIDAQSTFACRMFSFEGNASAQFIAYTDSLKKRKVMPNLEARLIGLQNKQSFSFMSQVIDLLDSAGIKLVEVDLFGTEVRHIAIDTKLGVSQDVLLENRLYRPGELINTVTLEQFERSLRQAPQQEATSRKEIDIKDLEARAPVRSL